MAGDYSTANTICGRLEQMYPGHPAASYGRACVIYAHMTDFEDTTGRAQFFRYCDSCITACERMKESSRDEWPTLA